MATNKKEEKKASVSSGGNTSNGSSGLANVESPVFSAEEEKILEYWTRIDAFQTSLKMSEGKPEYTFYDGPPFATGLPHYGHILAGTIKDIVTRFAHQTGHHVSRRFGWDCHGLPIEFEIDQKFNIKSKDDVLKMGIDVYNGHCRSIVQRYAGEWKTRITRLGRWIDFDNDYKTMDLKFMESVWWVFSQLHAKDLVYRGFKVMPYSTGCTTPLSNFEASLNYKDVRDPAVTVSFPLKSEPDVALLAWTTTPWTLPSNLALCVNPKLKYVKVLDKSSGAKWIIAESRLCHMFPTAAEAKGEHSNEGEDGIVKDALISFDDEPEDKSRVGKKYEILQTYVGTELVGLKYEPIFPFFASLAETKGAFRVLADDYVLDSSGTGIVHQAPAFGEDDYRVCETAGIISKGKGLVCPVDSSGCYTDEVKTWQGTYVKKADPMIMKDLRSRGRLVHHSTIIHSYPFCWRSDQPLIYKAVPSWFIAVEKIKDKILATNAQTYWVPSNIKDGRFVNWLKDARDWAVSRNRYWGTPLPIWISDDEKEIKVIGSVEELERLSGVTGITDIHKDKIDHITIPSSRGPKFGRLTKVPEVFDCWFESGSMPYGQLHYPFENKEVFESGFPADFIAEGLDQTRGWFYTLMVLSTALFDKPAFKNLIVNGLVLADDGKKMSKRLKNYPDPQVMVDLNGADALRLYLINSPVVRAEPLRFQKDGVREVVKQVFLPWFNAYRFFVENAKRYESTFGKPFNASANLSETSNIMDRWILASLQDLIAFVHAEMAAYRLYTVTPKLLEFIEQLTNWYVRGNRTRARGNAGETDARLFLQTLFEVLYSLCRIMAPFTPFMVESMYQNLKVCVPADQRQDSVHYLMVPKPNPALEAPAIVRAVKNMQAAVLLARASRETRSVSLKRPIMEVIIVNQSQAVLDDIKSLDAYVKEEVNVRNVRYTTERGKFFGAVAKPNKRALGHRLGGKASVVMAAVSALTNDEVTKLQKTGSIEVKGDGFTETIKLEEVEIELQFTGDKTVLESSSNGELLVVIDISAHAELLEEFVSRGVVARVQKLVKDSRVKIGDAVELFYEIIPTPKQPLHLQLAHTAPVAEKKEKPTKQKQQQQPKKEQTAASGGKVDEKKAEVKASGQPKKEKKPAANAANAPNEVKTDSAAPAKQEKAKKGTAQPKTEAKKEVAAAADAGKGKGKGKGEKEAPKAAATAAAPAATEGDGEGADADGEKGPGKRQLKKLAKANEKAAASAKKEEAGKKEPELKMPSLADVIVRQSGAISASLRRTLHPVALRPLHALVLGTIDCDVEGQWVRLWVTRPALSFNNAAIESTLTQAGVSTSQVAGVTSFLAGKDYGLLKERLASTGNGVSVTMEGKSVALQLGTHFFLTVPTAASNTKAAPAVPSPVATAAVAAQSASTKTSPTPAASPAKTKASSPTPPAASPKAAGKKGKK